MPGKHALVLDYIKSLKAGDRVSVRGLAETLGVSEGTAYKAIKDAESRGLVMTRPKAGTVRVEVPAATFAGELTLSSAVRPLGLAVLAGEQYADVPLRAVVVGDGSAAQLKQALSRAGENPVCVMGDRPELQQEALRAGAHLVVTGGARAETGVLALAGREKRCVLASEQDTYTLLGLLEARRGPGGTRCASTAVRDWMGMPLYLYHDDIVADWHRLYYSVFSMNARCAVVDDELTICGTLDAAKALASTPSQKVANLLTPPDERGCCTAEEELPMQRLAERMIADGADVAFVTRDGKMSGIITANDVLRYYQYCGDSDGLRFASALENIDRNPERGRNVYMIRVPEVEGTAEETLLTDQVLPAVIEAAKRHALELTGAPCTVESGTFYAPARFLASGDVMISSELMKQTGSGCTLELEMYDDANCYTRCTMMLSVVGAGEEEKAKCFV